MSKFCVLTTTKEFKATQEKFNLSKFTLELLLYHYYNNVVNSLDTFPSDDYIKELIDPTIITDDKKLKEFRDKNYNQEMIFDSIEDCRKKLEELRDLFNEDLIIVYTNSDEKLVIKIAKFEFKESERSILKRIEEQFEKIRNLRVPVKNKLTDVFDKAWLRDNKQFKNFRHAFDTAKIDKTLRDRIIEGIKLNPDMFDGKTFDLIIEILTSGLTDNLKDIYNKSLEKQVDTALEQHLMNFLKRYNIISKEASSEEIIAELKETYKDRDFQGFGLGAFDVLNKIIYLSNNRNKITAPEEFAHAFVELMGALKNEDFLFLNREVSKTDIYKQVYEQYKDIYVRKDGKPDLLMIRKEAIGLALAAAIVDRWESQNESEEHSKRDKTFFDKLIEWLEKILDLFKGAKRISFNQLVTSIATDVLDNNHTRLENYGNENFAKQEYQRTLDANPLALKYMQKMSEFGNVMTGSISVRFLGELYREGEDDLHDIDMIVPQSAHGVDLHSFVVRQTALNTRKANPILLEYVKNLDYFKKVLAEFPDMELAGAYPNNYKRFEYITVNAVMSKDHDLTRRFIQMSGSYADRLKNFTKEEQDLIYLFDFFLKEGEVRTVKDEKNKLNLAHFEESFTAKLIDMGRPKDVFDYQKWKAYKTATKANRGQVFFQSFKPGIEIKPNPMQQVALEEMTDYVHSRINGKRVPSFFLLNGMAGTGKTTIINLLLKLLTDEGLLITTVVGAVANKAKQNIFHKLDKGIIRDARVKQSSISGILGLFSSLSDNKPGTNYTSLKGKYGSVMKNKRGPSNIIIIDECSMIEDRHFDKLMTMALDLNLTMIFVGDSGQLPQIEDGNNQNKNNDFNAKKNSEISKTFLLASDEATVTLTERVRLGEGNPILDASEKFYVTPEDARKMKADGDLNLEDLETTITDLGAFIAKKRAMFNYDRDAAELFRKAFKERNTSLVKYVCDTNKNVYDMNVKVRKSIFGNNYTIDFKDGDIVMLRDLYTAINRYGLPDTLDNSSEGIVLHHRELRLDEDRYEGYCSPFILFCKKLNDWVDKNGTNFSTNESELDPELMRLWDKFAQPMNYPVSPIRKVITRKMDDTTTTSLHNIFADVYEFSNKLRGKIQPVRTVELTLLAQGESADEPQEYKTYAIHPEDWDKYEENIKTIYQNTGKRDEYTGKYTSIARIISALILHSYYGGRKTPSKSWINFFGAQLVDSYKNSRIRLQYGYAITSHKAQGSTYDVTIIDGDAISQANWGLADKSRMMYTAITRSSNITMVITDLTYDNTETESLDKLNDRINENRGNSKVDVPNDTYVPEPAERPSLRSSAKTVEERTKIVKLDGKDIDITYLEVNQPSDKLPEILNSKITLYNNTRNDVINQLFSDSNYTNILTALSQMGFTREYIENLLDSDDATNDLLLIKQYIETIYDVEQQQENIDAVRERALRDALIYVAKQYDKTLPLLTPMARTIHKLTTITAFNKQHITFDEKNHKYYYDGKPNNYSVTEFVEALKLNFNEDKIKAAKKKRATSKSVNGAAAIGNIADKQLRAMFAGTFRVEDFNDNPRITKEVKEVYKQIKEKLDEMFPDGYYVETNEDALRLFASILVADGRGNHNERFIAGTMDMLVVDAKGDTYIFDFKTHKANYEDEITDDFGTKSRYNAQTSWYSAMMEAVNGITAKDRNLLQINYLSDLSGNEPYDITVSLNDDNYVIQKVNLSNSSYTTFNGPTDIHFHDVVHTPEVPTTSTLIPVIKGMPNSITSLAQAQRKSPANLFDLIAARERQVNQQNINLLTTIVPESPTIEKNISLSLEIGTEDYDKQTKDGSATLKARKFYIKGREDAGYFEITTTNTSNVYSVHFKTTSKDALNEDEKQALFSKLAKSFPEGAIVSTYGEISRGGIAGLNRFKDLSFTQVSVRTIRHKEGGYTTIPVFVKNTLGKTLPTIMPAGTQFTRDSVENDTKSLYIFTDNTDRDSGSKLIEPDSWYAQTYGQGHHYPTLTSAIIRGLDNTRPISTVKWFYKNHQGVTHPKNDRTSKALWYDSDFEEFKQVVDKEFDNILEAWRSGKYDKIILPSDSGLKDGLINGDISNITYERTPKLFDYLHDKMDLLIKEIISQLNSTTSAKPEQPFTPINDKYASPQQQLEENLIDYSQLNNPFVVQRSTVNSIDSIANGEYTISFDVAINDNNNAKLDTEQKQKETLKMFLDQTVSNLPIGARITVDTGDDLQDIELWGILNRHRRLFVDTSDPTDIEINQTLREDAALINAAKKAGLMSKGVRLTSKVTLYPFTYARSYNEMKWSQQYSELNAKVPGKRLKALAVSAVYKISELVTMIQEGGNEDLFPAEYREKVRELKGADRATILSSQDGIGITGLANVVKEAYFNVNAPDNIRNTNLDKLNRKKTKEIVAIYDNFESFIRFGYAKLQALEGITVNETAVTDPRTIELFDGEEEMNILEIYGSSLEHWLVGFRSVSATMSLSQMIKEALNKFYELDENDDIIYDEYGFEKRINATLAVSTMLSWFIGTESVEDMVEKLKEKSEEHRWLLLLINDDPDLLDTTGRPIGLGLLITEDKDGNHIPQNEEFRSKFFNNMHLYFTKYGIIKKNGDIAIVNDKNVISAIANDALVITENNPDNFKDGILVGKAKEGEESTVVDKIIALRIAINQKAKDKKNLLVDDELAEMVEDLFSLLGITQFTTDLIKAIIGANPNHLDKIIQATSPAKGIANLFLSYNRDNKEIDANFRKRYTKEIQNIVKPFQDFILDRAEAVTYQDGKLYYSYVLPSYLSEFNARMKNSKEFIENEFKSEFFGLMKEGKKQWLNEWLKKLAESEQARKDFDHKVVLAANGKSYTKKTPKEYATSMINEYFYDKTKRLAWYRIPMMSNKPSEEYIRFTRYTTGYKDTIRNLLVNTAMQEIIRIADVIDRALRIEMGLLAPEDKIKFYDINVDYIKNAEDRHSKKELLKLGIKQGAGTRFVMLDYLQPFLDEALKDRKPEDKQYTGLGKQLMDVILGESVIGMKTPTDMFQGTTLNLLKRAIDYGMDRHFAEFLSVMEAEGVITRKDNGAYTTEVGKLGSTDKQIRENLEEFFWNDTYASLSIMLLYITDPIYYGNAEELQKRLAQLHAPGSRLNITAQDKNGNRYSDGVYRTIKVKDDKVVSEIIDKVGKVFDRLIDENRNNAGHIAYYRLLKEFIISELKKVNVTDAQTFCTPTAMRKKLGMLGEWNDAREEAYLRLASGRATKSDYDILMLPLKPFLFGQQLTLDNNGLIKTRRVGILVKTSEYLLVMADAITRSEDGEPTKLRAIFDVIEESLTDKVDGKLIPNGRGIDAISFESSIKTGLKAAINLSNLSNDEVKTTLRKAIYAGSDGTNKTSQYNSTFVDELDFRDYSIQQAVPTHFFGTQQLGSQSKALLFADVEEYERDENGAYKLDDKGNKIPRTIYIKDELGRRVETTVTEAKKEYFDLLAKSIEESCKKLVKELNLDTADVRLLNIAISRLLKKQILDDARFGSDLLWAVDINNNGDFNLPLSDPTHSTRIQQLLFSIIKDRVYKQKIHGGPVVQVSNWGNEALHIRYTNKDGETLLTEEEFNDAKNKLISTRNKEMSDTERRSIIASVRNKLNKFAPTTVEGKSLNTYQEYVDYHMPGGGVYYECFAPIYDKRLLDYEDEDGNIDVEAIRREEPQLLELIGYRIPTEAKYSMASLRIVGFLPREAGEGIMLPKEWTAISGSDFDVDKLYIMRRSFERITNKNKNVWEKGTTAANKINDRIFDIMLGVLESNQAQSKVVKIGTFDPLKIVGYKLAALREQVLQARTNATDKNNIDYDALGISYDNLPNSINDLKDQAIKGKNLAYNHVHLLFFKQNMVAGKLIGVFAQSNISHAYLSMYAISQGLDNGIKINKLKFKDFKLFGHNVGTDNFYIDPIYGFDGTPISDNIAAFLAASVDAVKDPILNLMNVNMKTVNSAMILARMGFNIEQIGLLFGQDIVTKVIQRMDQLDETFEVAIQNELDILKEAIGKDPELLDVKFSLDLDDRDLKANLVKPTLLIDYTVLSMLQQIHSVAEQTRSIVHMTRFNSISSAKGPDIMNSIVERHKTNNFWLGLGTDENEILRDAINNAILAVTRQRSNYFEDVIFGDRFILAKPHFESAFKAYVSLTGQDINNIRKKEAAKFANFYVDYMINKVYNLFDFSYDNRLKVMSEYPREILAKKSDERWLDNKFVQSIQQRQDEKDKYVGIDINLRNLEFDDIEDIKADFDEFADGDPETLMKIIEYMFNRGGFGFSPKTFTSLITNYIKEKHMSKYLDNIRLLEMAEDHDASLVDEFGNPILFDENGDDDVIDIVYQFLLHQDRKFPKFTINKAKTIELRLGQTIKSLQVGDTFAIRQKLEFGIYRLKMPNTEGTGFVIKLVKVDKIEDTIPAVTYVTVVEKLGGDGLGIELNTRKEGIKTIYTKDKPANEEDKIPPASYPDDPGPGFDNTTEEEIDSADNSDANWDSLMDSIQLESIRNPKGRLSSSSGYTNMKNDPLAGDNNYLAELLRANQSQPVALAILDNSSDIEASLIKAANRERTTGQTSVNPTIQLAKADLKALGLTDEQLANSDKNYDEKYQCD